MASSSRPCSCRWPSLWYSKHDSFKSTLQLQMAQFVVLKAWLLQVDPAAADGPVCGTQSMTSSSPPCSCRWPSLWYSKHDFFKSTLQLQMAQFVVLKAWLLQVHPAAADGPVCGTQSMTSSSRPCSCRWPSLWYTKNGFFKSTLQLQMAQFVVHRLDHLRLHGW